MPDNVYFGSPELEYYAVGTGSDWYTKWRLCEGAPRSGFKLHVAPQPQDAVRVAASVLPRLREIAAAHKVVKTLAKYLEQWGTGQQGKFITIYTSGATQAQQVLDAIEPDLTALISANRISRGYPPATRESNFEERELPVGSSGLVFTRWFDENSLD